MAFAWVAIYWAATVRVTLEAVIKRGPFYVFRLYTREKTISVDMGSAALIARKMHDQNLCCHILLKSRSEAEAFGALAALRSRFPSVEASKSPAKVPEEGPYISYDRLKSTLLWHLETISGHSDEIRSKLRTLHKCETDHQLIAKIVADCLYFRL